MQGMQGMQAPPPDDSGRQVIDQVERNRIFVMANGEFLISRNRLQRASVVLLQNLIDWLVQDEDLIAIRSKGNLRPLEPLEPSQAALIKYVNILGVPLLFVIAGIVRWRLRRNVRHVLPVAGEQGRQPGAAPADEQGSRGKEA